VSTKLFERIAEPPPPGWFSRTFLGSVDPAGALTALRNHFASGGEVRQEVITAVFKRYGVSQRAAQRTALLQLVSDSMTRILSWEPDQVSNGRKLVNELAQTIGLTSQDIEQAETRGVAAHIRSLIRECLADRKFTAEEQSRVQAVGKSLGMNQSAIHLLVSAEVQPLLQAAVNTAIADRRYSPQEEADLQQFAADLGVALTLDAESAAVALRYRMLWEIENGQLPILNVPISLQRKEVCHFSCHCSWRELRTRTVRVNYSGPTASIRIMKGVRWRVGSIAAQRVTETNLVEVAAGTLYITNKRVILDGTTGNKAVTWRTVFGQELFADAIKLEKSSGKDPYLFLPASEIESASTVISAVLSRRTETT
jgi:hypothetical protein